MKTNPINITETECIDELIQQCIEVRQDLLAFYVIHKNRDKISDLANSYKNLCAALVLVKEKKSVIPEDELDTHVWYK